MKIKSELDVLNEISRKLDVLIITLTCQGKSEDEVTQIFMRSGLSCPELSTITGISVAAIQKRIERARKRVKK